MGKLMKKFSYLQKFITSENRRKISVYHLEELKKNLDRVTKSERKRMGGMIKRSNLYKLNELQSGKGL